jgi:organic radical activating enzyme
MKHFLYNLTWRCQNSCSYCWVKQSVCTRREMIHAQERPADHWIMATQRDAVDLVDIAGGEPTLLPWLPVLMQECPSTRFGLSTNGRSWTALGRLLRSRPDNLISVTYSYHPEAVAPEVAMDTLTLIRRYETPMAVNIVDTPFNRANSEKVQTWCADLGVTVHVSPNEHVDILDKLQPQGLACQGGIDHLVMAPDGSAWPCLTTLRSPYWAEHCLGNWLDGNIDLSRKPQPCYLNCTDYFVLPQQHDAGDMWGVRAHPAEAVKARPA